MTQKKVICGFLICLLSLSASFSHSQIKRTGLPFIRNYERTEYIGGRQTWDITQNDQNLMFFANNSGILEFDGTNWNIYPVSNRSIVRSVAAGDNGKIYAGAYNEFGYLQTQKNGRRTYHSLKDKISDEYKDFGEIWRIFPTENGVIFQSFTSVFFYKDDTIKVLAHNRKFHFAFYVNEDLYISEENEGLMKYNGQEFEPVPGGSFFKKEKRVWTMQQFDSERLLIGTQNDGLFIYKDGDIKPWTNEANDFLIRNQLFQITRLPSGQAGISGNYFALGSIQNGVIVVNKDGEILQHINKERGLQNNTILSAFSDHEGNLWIGLDNGIDYLELNSPVTYIGEGFSLEGTGYSTALYKDKLYLGTNQALFYNSYSLEDGMLQIDDDFKRVDGTKGQVWNLSKINGKLFCGHNNGAYIIEGTSARKISDVQGGWNFLQIPGYPEYVLQGSYTGIARLKKENGKWKFDRMIKGFKESSRIETWDNYGNLWISHGYKGIYRLRFNDRLDSVIQTSIYQDKHGLPSRLGNNVFSLDDKIYAATEEGIYRFVFFADHFEKDTLLSKKLNGGEVSDLRKDKYGNIWYFSNYSKNIGLIKGKGSPQCFNNIEVLHKLDRNYVPAFEHINVIDSSNIIIGTVDGFAHFDPTFKVSDSARFETLLRKFTFFCKGDTTNYYNINGELKEKKSEIKLNELKSIKIDFSATFYEDLDQNQFSYILKGYDKNWSDWSSQTMKEYTNLSPGDYKFRVKAKNIYGRESKISEFQFSILPPWYRTIWAYIVYAILFGGMVYFFIYYLKRKIQKEKLKLKEKQKEELRKQREQYELERLEMDNRIIKLKNEKLQSDINSERAQVELKNKELASQAVNLNRKNEILNYIKNELEKVNKKVNPDAQFQIKLLNKKIQEDVNLEEDWKHFKQYFDEVQGDFIKRIKEQYPELTPNDLKLCAYLRMNLSTKEIAPFLGITPRGVEIHRYRLRKKLGLYRDVNLVEFLLNI